MLSHYCRTRKGHQELKARTHKLTARQRALLLIIENVQWNDTDPVSVQQLSTGDNLQRLLELQLIEAVNDGEMGAANTVLAEVAVAAQTAMPVPQPATEVVLSRYKLILTAVAPKKPFGTLYDFIALPANIVTAAASPQASELAANAEQSPVSAELAEEKARKSVFLSYLPYLGGSKKSAADQADKPVAVAAPESRDEQLIETPALEVQALAEVTETVAVAVDDPISAAVEEQPAVEDSIAAGSSEDVTLVAAEADAETLVAASELDTVAVEAVSSVEVDEAQPELVANETVAVVVDESSVVEDSIAAETSEVLEVAIHADAEILVVASESDVVAVEVLSSEETDTAQPELVAHEQIVAAEESLAVTLASEASEESIPAVDAPEVQQAADVQAETVNDVDHTVVIADKPVGAAIVLQPVNVISTLKVHVKQPAVTASFGHRDSLSDVHVELVAKDGLDDGMLYIANHNKKWQERHIPLLVWTVTMPGTKKAQKKLDLPLKFYNVDEFEQVWDAKPPYGSH